MRDSWTDLRAGATGLVCHAAIVLAVASSLSGQVVPESRPMFALPDRQLLRMLESSRELLDQGRYSEAVRLLATILEAKDDYFFMAAVQSDEPDAGRQYRSLQNEARSVLSGMPPAAQEAYELRFGAVARKLLDEALAERDIEQILEVQRRYFGSTAGYEATYLLGYHSLSEGRFLAAMRHFQTLWSSRAAARYEPELSLKLAICWQWSGEPAPAKEVLVELQKRFPRARFAIGERSVELFRRSDDALAWLRNIAGEPPVDNWSPNAAWTVFRHDPARQGRGSGGPTRFTQPVWRQAVSDRFELTLALQAQRDEFYRGAEVAIPSLTPLAVDDIVVMRTPQRLVAVDFETGKRLWQVDQPAPESSVAATAGSDESRFLYWDTLKQRSWLDLSYGWSQQLALIWPERRDSTIRRTSGISPSCAAGILICPTGVGAVVAVDLSTRHLLWAYEYPETRPARETFDAGGTWADSCAVISGRHVLITPAEAPQMHCLDLPDGRYRWSLDRGNWAFLAGVDRDVAVVVGGRQLTAIELDTGKAAAGWPLPLPAGSLPSGRGYHADGRYYLPLNVLGEGEVATIQLDPPAIIHRSPWPGGAIPGNLICYRGQILSQNVDWLESF